MLKHRVALVILDGWGHTDRKEGNALVLARTPYFDSLFERYPHILVGTSGRCVGLPDGQMGNSEVGHTNMGAGRIVYQDFTRINAAIEDDSFFTNPTLVRALALARERGSALHLMGLLSDGGVHSHQDHLEALLDAARRAGLGRVYVHALLDGRDTSPTAGADYLARLLAAMESRGVGQLGLVSGRYYMMDRDRRWERVKLAYRALVEGAGRTSRDAVGLVRSCYASGETDEFVVPTVMVDAAGRPVARLSDGDVFLNFNFRADRVRQITAALTRADFTGFPARPFRDLHYVCMTRYDETWTLPVMFPPAELAHTFGELVSGYGQKQLRIAETEKYAHVTFFFNGGQERVFAGEERELIPSPKVPTYDLKPEMSAFEVTDRLIERLRDGGFSAIVMNYANCDMVGHTGKLDAAVAAVEALDRALARAVPHLADAGFTVFLTADHGNIEQMIDYETGAPFTEHTTNPVPLLVTDASVAFARSTGKLADLAPTMLAYAGCTIPPGMRGDVLIRPP
jgi:2,3-bisphosphoglycerate-independent phosphoglycerate mutase